MKYVFNPFLKIAGSKALGIGLLFAIFTFIISIYSYASFDGVLDFHKKQNEYHYIYIVEHLISWLSIIITFGISGMIFSKSKFRWIDIMGTTLLARAPLLITSILAFFIPLLTIEDIQSIKALEFNPVTIVALLLIIGCTVWMVALLYHAFKVSLNLKGQKSIWGFIISLLLAEILSQVLLSNFYSFI